MSKNDKIAPGKKIGVSISRDESLFSVAFSYNGSVNSAPKGLKPELNNFYCHIDNIVVRKHINKQSFHCNGVFNQSLGLIY